MSDPRQEATAEADEQWRFGVDDVDEKGVVRESLKPGDPSLENVFFVLLGVGIALLVVARGLGVL